MHRRVHSEKKDARPGLPSVTLSARRQLQWLNGLMGNFRWLRRVLAQEVKSKDRLLELEASEGELGFALLKDFAPPPPKGFHPLTPIPFPPTLCESGGVLTWEGTPFFESPPLSPIIDYTGQSNTPRPPNWPPTWHWRRMDILDLEEFANYSVILSNFSLYALNNDQLGTLGKKLHTGPRLLLFNEPHRSHKLHTLMGYAHAVNLYPKIIHQAKVSLESGFVGDELPKLLGLKTTDWALHCDTTPLGSYRLIAKRRNLTKIH